MKSPPGHQGVVDIPHRIENDGAGGGVPVVVDLDLRSRKRRDRRDVDEKIVVLRQSLLRREEVPRGELSLGVNAVEIGGDLPHGDCLKKDVLEGVQKTRRNLHMERVPRLLPDREKRPGNPGEAVGQAIDETLAPGILHVDEKVGKEEDDLAADVPGNVFRVAVKRQDMGQGKIDVARGDGRDHHPVRPGKSRHLGDVVEPLRHPVRLDDPVLGNGNLIRGEVVLLLFSPRHDHPVEAMGQVPLSNGRLQTRSDKVERLGLHPHPGDQIGLL